MDKKRIRHMGLAAVLSIAMLGTTVPVTVLAATPNGTAAESSEAQAPSSKEERKRQRTKLRSAWMPVRRRTRTLRRKRMPQRRRRRKSSRNTIGCKPS